jgi:hypothetical protein
MTTPEWAYAGLSRRKMEVARRHLIEFDNEFPRAQVGDKASPTDSRAELEGHADGCVLQAYAAFDTLACGVALRFGLTDPHRASFNGLVRRLEEPSASFSVREAKDVLAAVRTLVNSDGWQRLSYYRNHAGHRGVVLQRTHHNQQEGFTARIGDIDSPYHENRSEVRPILVELVEWAESALPPLLRLLGES